MAKAKSSPREPDYLGKALDIAIRLLVIGTIVVGAFKIFSPFLVPVVWGIVISIALYPVFDRVKGWLGGRNRLAGTLFIIVSLAALIVPTVMLTESVIDGAISIGKDLDEGTFRIPPPTEKVKTWPLVGESLYSTWSSASADLDATATKLGPQLKKLGAWLAGAVAGLGGAFILTLIALIIAGILMMTSEGGGRTARTVATRLAGEDGPAIVDISIGTIRSVVRGVILVAALQGLLALIGLFFASVPAAGFWALLVMIVAVIQLPPIIILGPIAVYVFSANDSTVIAVIFLIWSLLVSGSDGFLKPIFLGRGVQVPMLVILIGAIGGMLGSGVIGLFIGPVIFAIAYQLFTAWVRDDEAPGLREPKPDSAKR